MPAPTWPWRSPTTTTAVKLKRRPPLTTFATRLMKTTFSWRSRPVASMRCPTVVTMLLLEPQPAGARCFRQRLDPAVEGIATAVEDDGREALRLRPLGDKAADQRRDLRLLLAVRLTPHRRLQVGRGGKRLLRHVVDHLGVDVRQAAEDAEARLLVRAAHVVADARVAADAGGARRRLLLHRPVAFLLTCVLSTPRYLLSRGSVCRHARGLAAPAR